jgi:FkbH-like protein
VKQNKDTEKNIKCIVWDLDNTLWEGVLAEGDEVHLRPRIKEILQTLDGRGILNSIASRNDHDEAINKLGEFDLADFFVFPEIGWNSKSASVGSIQKNLNVQLNSIMFVDDDVFEREEVQHVHPDVTCFDAAHYELLSDHPRLQPGVVTAEACQRRLMYLAEMKRRKSEGKFEGPRQNFLASLNMNFTISAAREEDLKRAEELTVRTSQLNATGRVYSYDDLSKFIHSDTHELLICELEDRFGRYGKIGLALMEIKGKSLHLKLLLMSCRVMARGVGTVLISHIMQRAKGMNKTLRADFRHTSKNRMMYIALKFAGFMPLESIAQNEVVFEADLTKISPFPPYMKVIIR